MPTSIQDQHSAATELHATADDEGADALLAEAIALARRVDRRLAGRTAASAEPDSPLSTMRVEN
jgi:hypothetical protein